MSIEEVVNLLISGDDINLKVEAMIKLVSYFPTDKEKWELLRLVKEKRL